MTNPDNVGGLPELPKISPHDHPEPRSMMWSNLEIQWIQRYARAYAELCRAAPAGSGEVPDWMVRVALEASRATEVKMGSLSKAPDEQRMRNALAALLRKLRQGAE